MTITNKALKNLVLGDQVPPFENCVVQYMQFKNILPQKTLAQQKQLLLNRQTEP